MSTARIALLVAAFGALTFCFLNPNPDVAHPRAPQLHTKRHSIRSAPGPHELDFPYYSLRDGSNSTLLLVNRSPDALPFEVALRSLSGKTLLAPSQTIPAHEKLSMDVGGLVLQLGGTFLEISPKGARRYTLWGESGRLPVTSSFRTLRTAAVGKGKGFPMLRSGDEHRKN
jgi:hypothetical protein